MERVVTLMGAVIALRWKAEKSSFVGQLNGWTVELSPHRYTRNLWVAEMYPTEEPVNRLPEVGWSEQAAVEAVEEAWGNIPMGPYQRPPGWWEKDLLRRLA